MNNFHGLRGGYWKIGFVYKFYIQISNGVIKTGGIHIDEIKMIKQ